MLYLSLFTLFIAARAQVEIGEECVATNLVFVDRGSNVLTIDDPTGVSGSGSTFEIQSPSGQDISFLDSAVSTAGACPDDTGVNCLYLLYDLGDGTQAIGYLLTDSLDGANPQTFGEINLGDTTSFTSITFDSAGNLYGIEGLTTGDVYQIDLTTGATTLFSDGADDQLCDTVVGQFGCWDTIFYNAEEDTIYRLSSGQSNILLCTVPDDECSTVVNNVADCMGVDQRIVSITYVDEDSASITCAALDGTDTTTSTLEELDLKTPETVDLTTTTSPTTTSGVAYWNANSMSFCAADFDGEEAISQSSDSADSDSSTSS